MALEEGRFFTGSITDRRHNADGLAEYCKRFLTSGVWAVGDNLNVSAAGGMTVSVGFGEALVDGYPYRLRDNGTGPLILTVEASTALPRIDRVVIRKDVNTQRIYAYIKKGTPAASPFPPGLTRTATAYEISLKRISIPAGAVQITTGNLTDERTDSAVCGIVSLKLILPIQIRPGGSGIGIGGAADADEFQVYLPAVFLDSLRVKDNGTHNTIVTNSATEGEYIFGGTPTDGGSIEDYIRVGRNKLQYKTIIDAVAAIFDIFHSGNLAPLQGVSDGSYYGIKLPDGSISSWIRTTVSGIIPYQSGGASALGTAGWPFNNIYTNFLDAGSYAQATGRSASWGSANGILTGAFNARMGATGGATWLLSGSQDGTFRCGIQALNADGTFRFYAGSYYYALNGSSGTIYHSGNLQVRTGQCTLNSTDPTTVNFSSGMSGTPRVNLTPRTTTGGVIAPKLNSVSSSGFTAIIGGSGFSGIVCDYIAIWQAA